MTTIYTCPTHLYWADTPPFIHLVDESRQQTYQLDGPEAVIWQWVMLGFRYSRLLPLVAALLHLPQSTAEHQLRGLLAHWHAAGWLEVTHG